MTRTILIDYVLVRMLYLYEKNRHSNTFAPQSYR